MADSSKATFCDVLTNGITMWFWFGTGAGHNSVCTAAPGRPLSFVQMMSAVAPKINAGELLNRSLTSSPRH